MTTDQYVRKQWRARYGTPPGQQQKGAFHHEYPEHVQVVILDFMQFVKSIGDQNQTIRQVIREWVNRIKSLFRAHVQYVVVCVDRGSPPVKTIHCHAKRYSKVKRFGDQDSPILSHNLDKPLHLCGVEDKNWMRLAGNQNLLRREVYPLLWNALTDPQQFQLRPGQMLVLSGFPSKMRQVTTVHGLAWERQFTYKDTAYVADQWHLDDVNLSDWPITAAYEQQDPELYRRVFRIVCLDDQRMFVERAPEWENDILEADNAVFYFQQVDLFRYRPTMIHINDGDAISIALLQSHERLKQDNSFVNHQYICLRYREGKEAAEKRKAIPHERNKPPPRWEYCDVNMLHCMLDKDPAFFNSGVSNPQLTFVMLNILAGTDFFANYCPGIGKQYIWQTFFQHAAKMSHLVQWHACALQPNPLAPRRAIVDETLFERFTYYVYANKYGKAVRKKNKGSFTFEILKTYCSQLKRKQNQVPTQRACKMFARQLGWNIQYWLNACRNIDIDPFETWRGFSYWTYQRDKQTQQPQIAYAFSPKQKPMDEAYKRNLYKRKRAKQPLVQHNQKKKKENPK